MAVVACTAVVTGNIASGSQETHRVAGSQPAVSSALAGYQHTMYTVGSQDALNTGIGDRRHQRCSGTVIHNI